MAINAKSIKYKDTSSYKELLDIVWPVGSTYLTTSDVSPSQTLGGTWIEKKDGMIAACGSGTIYSGRGKGEAQGSYALTIAQIPSHTHGLNNHTHSWSGTTSSNGSHTHNISRRRNGMTQSQTIYPFDIGSGTAAWEANSQMVYNSGAHTHTISGTTGGNSSNTTATGGTSSYVPYSYSFHCWVRTA